MIINLQYVDLIVFAVRVFRDVLGFLELCLQERNALVVRKTTALQCFAVPATNRRTFSAHCSDAKQIIVLLLEPYKTYKYKNTIKAKNTNVNNIFT